MIRPPAIGWLLLAYSVLATAALVYGLTEGRSHSRAERYYVAFVDSVRVELNAKRCVYMPPVDTVRNPRR